MKPGASRSDPRDYLSPAERQELDRLLHDYAVFRRVYRNDPAAFVHDCFDWPRGDGPTVYQDEILSAIPAQQRVCVRGPHGLGKTAMAAWVILWFALTRDVDGDWKCVATASAWRQLTKFLFPEVHKWARRLRWDRIGRAPFSANEMLTLNLKLSTGEAFAVASDNPAYIEGAHADHLLYVFDESKAIPGGVFDAAEGAFSNAGGDTAAEAYALAISTPGEPQGRFYEIHKRQPGLEDWWTRHVTLDETIEAGRVSREWAEQRRRQWGEGSAVYQNRTLGEFAANAEGGIIPLAWVEAANERWREWDEAGRPGEFEGLGVDVGRGGDKSTLARRVRWLVDGKQRTVIAGLERNGAADTMAVAGRVAGILRAHGGTATVDVIGIGAGVVDRTREQGLSVIAFNASERSEAQDRTGEFGFVNRRSEGWWTLREWLDPTHGEWLALPPDDLLTGDLTAPKYRLVSGGKLQVESKDDIRKRLGRSTDDGDAVMMALATESGSLWAWGAGEDGDDE